MAQARTPAAVHEALAGSFLRGVSQSTVETLMRRAVTHHVRAGEVFIVQSGGQRCAIVLTGLVRVFIVLENGNERTVGEVMPSGAVGIAAFTGLPSNINVQAILDSDVLEMDPAQLTGQASLDATLAVALLREVSARLRDTEQQMAAEFGPVAQRLSRRLLDSAAEAREEPAVAHVSHAELALQLGCSREWITKLLADFQRRALIQLEGRRRIRVTDPLGLLAMSRAADAGPVTRLDSRSV
ncbi:MAG TPA: Crp/Fnr family transcriptional regulator [Candidatus Limnocylindria bacterium]|nr:Crp/Fnr family transcriptional regulator [Candidatus Limnocylindria bacterium]